MAVRSCRTTRAYQDTILCSVCILQKAEKDDEGPELEAARREI